MYHMLYEEALCQGELGMHLMDEEMVEDTRELFVRLGALADEEKLRSWQDREYGYSKTLSCLA